MFTAGPPGGHSFSDLESTRIDFDESITTPSTTTTATSYNNTAQHNQTLESDNNSDIVIEEKKPVSSDDFKIVFISSESKSGSELNSSLECTEEAPPSKTTTTMAAAADDQLRHVTGDYIDEMDWVNYQKKVHPRGHHQKAARRLSDSPRLSDKKRSPRLLPDPDRRFVEYRLYICRACRGSVIISTFTVFNQIDDFGIVFPAVSCFYIALNFLKGCR
jgi:hypothetical protein